MSEEPTIERVHRAEKLLGDLIAWMGNYYVRSETMALSGVVAMIALIVAVLNATQWPPQWVPQCFPLILRHILALFGLFILWFILHIYIQWQLRNRRAAAIMQSAAIRALAGWVTREPRDDDLIKKPSEKTRPKLRRRHYFIPPPRAALHHDIERMDCPAWLAGAIEKEEQCWRKSKVECFITIGSVIILFIMMILRTLIC
ncbi:MAG: hypothetical protein LUQ65_15315 [Candidatus Helarchaeota archaeon]|nr:hypothetical protein [Candidatus Helarchaeota archaeon]